MPSFKGASTHVLAVCRGLRAAFDVQLHSLGRVALAAHPGFVHRPFTLREPNYLRRGELFRQKLRERLRSQRPARAHFRSPWEGVALLEAGVPSIYEINGLPSIELQSHSRATARTLAQLATEERFCVQHAENIICPSEVIAECVRRRYGAPAAKLHVIPNGYDLAAPAAQPAQPAADAPLRAVYIGTLHPWQGLELLWPALHALRGRVTLDLIGPPHREFSAQLEQALQRFSLQRLVQHRGPMHRAALARLLPSYHLSVAPLRDEPRNTEQGCCPLKILDALSHGLPLLASDLPVVRALLRHDDNALLLPASDSAAWQRALEQLLADPQRLARLRARAQPSLVRLPDWDAHGARVLALHRGAASNDDSAASNRACS